MTLSDAAQRAPLVSVTFAAACVWVQVWLFTLEPALTTRVLHMAGLIPAVLVGRAQLPPELALVAPPWTFLSSLFLHAQWSMWALNVAGLALFGPALERAMSRGHAAFLLLVCGVVGGLVCVVFAPQSLVPVVGAGAPVAGAAAATCLLRPRSPLGAGAVVWAAGALSLSLARPHAVPGLGLLGLLAGAGAGAALVLCLKHRELPVLQS